MWKSEDTIVFKPDSKLNQNTLNFTSVDLSKIIKNEKNKLKFNFVVQPIKIKKFSYEFLPNNSDKIDSVIFQGKIEFSCPVNFYLVSKMQVQL